MKSNAVPTPPSTPVTTPTPVTSPRLSYGNIYTPHAGSMIIQVQRESGLQSRTIVLSPRQVRILNFFASRAGKILAACLALVAIALTVEAVRVPGLTYRISRMEHTAQRLDSLERSLSEVQKRYDQVRAMMGIESGVASRTGGAPTAFAPASRSPVGASGAVSSDDAGRAPAAAGGTDAIAPLPIDAGAATTGGGAAPQDGGAQDGAPVATVHNHRRRVHAQVPATPPEQTTDSAAVPDTGVTPSPQADQQ